MESHPKEGTLMRMKKLNWLASIAMATGLGFSAMAAAPGALAAPSGLTSFSGAYLAGRAAEADNDLDSAISYYKQALAVSPDNQALQQSVMLALVAKGLFDEALPYADSLKSVAEVERFSRVALAVDAFRKDNFVEAEAFLKLALESDLDRLITGVMTAWAKAGAGDIDGSMKVLDGLDGPEWYALFRNIHRALILDFGGRKEDARAIYDETAIARSAADVAPEAYVRLVEAYAGFLARDGKKDEALVMLERVNEFSAARPTTLALRRDIAAGTPVPPFVSSARDGAAEILLDIASALNRGGGESFVRLYLQFARALSPQNDAVLIQLGGVAEQQRNLEEAIEIYGMVSPDSPLKRVAELQLGLDLAELQRTEEAVSHLKVLLDQEPDDMRAYLALGGVHAGVDDFRSAAEVYDRAAARLTAPTRADWSVFYQRGIAYERLKEWEKAEPNFRKALELFPNQPQVLNYLGYSWIDMNMNLEEGLEMIRKAVELRPSDGFIIDSLGWGYYRLGRFEEAVTELERAVALQPADPVLNDHLGDAYWRVGRKLEATFQWAHARDLKPDDAVLANVLTKLKEGLPELPPKAMANLDPGNAVPGVASDIGSSAADITPPTDLGPKTAEPAPAKEATAPSDTDPARPSYKVGRGQSLWSIAADVLGDGKRFQEILDLNPILGNDPNRIFPGQELRMP